MACRITELVIDAADPGRVAAFWCEVLGYVELDREEDGSIQIGPPDAGAGGMLPTVVVNAGRDPRRGKLPVHFDLNATDRDQEAELARLLALGAVPVDVGQTGDESWHVLADPEGNEFCLLRARVEPLRDTARAPGFGGGVRDSSGAGRGAPAVPRTAAVARCPGKGDSDDQ